MHISNHENAALSRMSAQYEEKQFKQARDLPMVQPMLPIIYDSRDHQIQPYNNIETTIGDEISLSNLFHKMLLLHN